MAKTKWGVVYNADALSLDDMLHLHRWQSRRVRTASGRRRHGVTLSFLTAMAGTLKAVRVGTGIAQMARPPVLTALSALSLAEYTNGRFVLGVGTAPRDWNKGWHGFDVPHPVPRIREYIECIRAAFTATSTRPANYTGEYYQLRDYIRFLESPVTQVPIYLAGVNPFMIQLAGSHSDGLILGPLTRISQRGGCIGALDLRKSFFESGLSQGQGEPDADGV
jgi:alkanesulfonate monooxygenase SsuD/methylene tetrahydromethanopterin reductase-like flavin-dependent oxidoreductase (luciferase family)